VDLDYPELIDRNGTLDPDVLLERLVWGVHEHRQFPAIDGPTVMPEPPSGEELLAMEVEKMEIDEGRLAMPLKRVCELQRLLHPHRGAKLHGNMRDAPISAAVNAMKVGVTSLPLHLSNPLSLFSKFNLLARRRGHAMEVFLTMFDKTGSRLFTGSDDWLIKIWSTHSGLLVTTLRGHKAAITYMCIDPTNQYLASASDDNTIRVWSLATYTNVAVLQHVHTKSVVELSWSPAPGGNVLVSMALDGFINAWELLPQTGRMVEIETLLGKDVMLKFRHSHMEPVNSSPAQCGPLSPCGTRALVSCKDGSVRILALNPLRQLQRIVAHNSNVPLAVWSYSSANRFATISDDGTSKIYEYMNASRGWVLKHTMPVIEVIVTGPKPKMLAAKWSMRDDLLILSFQRTAAQHFHHLKVFDTNTGKCLGNLIGHSHDVHSLAIHPTDHRILATAGYDQRIIIWNIYTLSPIHVLELPNYEDEECPITEMSWNPNGTQLAVTDIIGTFTLFGIGPNDSFKGPVEQFFSTDYHETTIDADGFVVDNETQLPPHLTKRTPLCFRTGLLHDSPPLLPPLNDPRTKLAPEEIQLQLERRTQLAEAEDAQYVMGEPAPEARPQRHTSAVGAAAAPNPAGAVGSPPLTRTRTQTPAPGGVLAAHGFALTSRGRLRRNTEDLGAAGAGATTASGGRGGTSSGSRRPKRSAAIGSDDDILLDSDEEDAELRAALEESRRAQLEKEDLEEDFDALDSESDDSISSDGNGHRPRDAIEDDLYWSGDDATSEFLSPSERRAIRESRRLAGRPSRSSRPSRPSRSNPSRRAGDDSDDDSDEDYGARRRRNRNRSASSTSNRPNGARLTRSSAPRSRNTDDDEDAFLDILSNGSSDIPLFDSGDEEHKPSGGASGGRSHANNREKQRERSGKTKPPEYPSWVTQEAPAAIFCPQLDDELVFFQTGYTKYLKEFEKHFKGDMVPTLPPNMPDACYCVVTAIEFQSDPIVHAIITLSSLTPPHTIPQIDTDPSHDTQCLPPSVAADASVLSEDGGGSAKKAGGGSAKKKSLKVKISVGPSPPPHAEPKPYTSMRDAATRLLVQSSSSSSTEPNGHGGAAMDVDIPENALNTTQTASHSQNGSTSQHNLVFQVVYHGNADVPDYLVLASRFNQGMGMPWYPSKKVSAWIASEDDPNEGEDYPGTVLEINGESPWEAVTILWEDESSGTEKMSPWELEAVDSKDVRIPVFVESLEEAARNRIAEGIEQYISANAEMCEIFRLPVPLAQWPSYYHSNPWPVYLELILSRLRNGWYRNVEALKRDIQCIHSNSRNFNGESVITEGAASIASSLTQIVNQHAPSILLVPKSSQLNGSHFTEEAEPTTTTTNKKSSKSKQPPKTASNLASPAKSRASRPSASRAPFEEFGSELDAEGDAHGLGSFPDDDDDDEEEEAHPAKPSRPKPKSKSKPKKKRKGTFGEVYESDTTDPDDLLPYKPLPPPNKKVAKTPIVDPKNFMPVHAENQAQRDADAAAETAIDQSRQSLASSAAPSAPIAPISSLQSSAPTSDMLTETDLAARPKTRLRVKVTASGPPTLVAPPVLPTTRRMSARVEAHQEAPLSEAENQAIESPSGRPVRSTRNKRNFSTLGASDEDAMLEEEEPKPSTRSRRR
jgi:WD40 repeat protein